MALLRKLGFFQYWREGATFSGGFSRGRWGWGGTWGIWLVDRVTYVAFIHKVTEHSVYTRVCL